MCEPAATLVQCCGRLWETVAEVSGLPLLWDHGWVCDIVIREAATEVTSEIALGTASVVVIGAFTNKRAIIWQRTALACKIAAGRRRLLTPVLTS